MEKEKMEGMIIDYIDNRLNAIDRQLIEQELMQNEQARKLYHDLKEVISAMEQSAPLDPSPRLKENFDKAVRRAVHDASGSRRVFFQPSFYRAAAAVALLIIGGGIGFWISKNNTDQQQLAEMAQQMEQARKELADTKSLMLALMGNDQSASQRIKGVNVAITLQKPDQDIVDALFKTLSSDPNTNVRLAALDALARFHADPSVRNQLIQSLSRQTDPMVQIKLIQLMVEMNEKAVVDDLQKLVDDAGTMKAVKDEAYSGILKLS